MSTRNARPTCSHLTRRGRPCRNVAMLGTRPPVCRLHRDRPAPEQLPLPNMPPVPPPPRRHFYFADAAEAEASDPGADLTPEIALVRGVLRRLVALLEEDAGELPPGEMRRLAGLVFSGTRTVAHLLGQRAARPDELRHWLDDALDALAAEHKADL